MPFIKLKLSGNFTKKQREAVTKEFSDTLLRIAGNSKDDIHIIIDEVGGASLLLRPVCREGRYLWT